MFLIEGRRDPRTVCLRPISTEYQRDRLPRRLRKAAKRLVEAISSGQTESRAEQLTER